ncbi:ABC transporter ATP-binding protein [Microbacterium xanthum]|uniref:ABC transporter ATP-binding protein n=1 Tax=Microbacterium xanthum TaxID=3079794 RepID=UPI002AD40BDC|nr:MULTISPECIES: sn-glycerol-3-phosphate ABC transporter ATP-binding protein UgpC [unclassified Microbacterium]MDZ8171762.1 sn-glycerol-3-phosphate ABC transporter ATP-binding protein UgpC [Microbacterium sp. KSW-48]MDZ8200135.1 sn-glycerol-3-phosphate ABC transporter ATP-binding protein UgpC [Microbacterium sp. SSW1-59]
MASITLTGVVKTYDDGFTAVKGIDLEIADGEFVILVGPSGCGKSTLLRMIVGLEDITDGELRIDDTVVNDKAPKDRNLAMVFQNYALYPHLTVYENIAFPMRLKSSDVDDEEIDARVTRASALLELDEHLQRKPANLSGGQRQRVAMGRAIVRNADAFLFDEPLSNLDAKLRGQMRTEIARLQRSLGITTVYVTHDQTEAMTLGDRVAVLRRGELQQVASPRGLYEQPVNLFVAGFIGSPPMNFLHGAVQGDVLRLPMMDVPLDERLRAAIGDRSTVIVGVRPDAFQDVEAMESEPSGGVRVDVDVEMTEWLGEVLYAYVPFEIDDAVRETLSQLDRDLDGESLRTEMVVALNADSLIVGGDQATLWFSPDDLYIFDPETSVNLTRDEERAEQLEEQGRAQRKRALERAKEREAKATA